jgi:hypothetical protein
MVTFRSILCCLLLIYGAMGYASATLYRCVDAEGNTIFQQTVCNNGKQSEVELTDTRVGWVPPKVVKKEVKAEKKTRPKKRAVSMVKEQRKHDKSCWRAEQNLEQTERKLRRGYKAGAGDRLRAKQERYESYLKEFC